MLNMCEQMKRLAVSPEPRMNTAMHRTTPYEGEGLSLAVARIPKRRTMRQHTAATGK